MSGIRYSNNEKAKVLNFIEQWDKDHGRGGKLAAFKKFKVSPLTIRSWIAEEGKKPVERTETAKAVNKNVYEKTTVQVSGLREKVASHIEKIEKYSSQIAELQAKIDKEKEAIQKDFE